MFNLRDDPHELENLADDRGHAEKVRELLALLSAEQQRYADTARMTVKRPLPAAVDETFFTRGAHKGRDAQD